MISINRWRAEHAFPLLWLDYGSYATRLIADDHFPWLDATAWAAWQRQAQSLLDSDVVTLPLLPAAQAWVESDTDLQAAMAEGRRDVQPLKTLLADERLRGHLREVAANLRAVHQGRPLVLVSGSPYDWVSRIYVQARNKPAPAVDLDLADSAAVYIADFLRTFSESNVDALLIEEPQMPVATAELMEATQPMRNAASHYRWEVGYRFSNEPASRDWERIDFVISPGSSGEKCAGIEVKEEFWANGSLDPCIGNGFLYAEVPVDGVPERVLERVSRLRSEAK